MKRYHGLLAALLAVGLLVAACGGSQPSTAPQAQAQPENKQTAPSGTDSAKTAPKETLNLKLGLGNMGSTIYLPIVYALNAKLFEKEGLNVETVELKGGAQVTQALVESQADVAFGAMEHVIKYKQQGVDLMLIATLTEQPGAALVVDAKYKDSIKSVKDLKGKKVGVTSPGSGSHAILLLMMEKAGLAATDVEAVGVGFDVPKAFADGKVVAAITYAPFIEQLVGKSLGFIPNEPMTDLRTPAGVTALYGNASMPMVTMMVHKQMLSKNPELAQRVTRAIVSALREIAANSPEEIAKIVPAPEGIDQKAYLDALTRAKVWLSQDGQVKADTISAVTGALKHLKALPSDASIDPSSIMDNSFAAKS